MLILQRRIGESMVIGGGITVTVMNVRGNAVSLGIEAPKQTPIRRSELGQNTCRPSHQAAGAPGDKSPVYEPLLHRCPDPLCL
jgi:carbon storage regulator